MSSAVALLLIAVTMNGILQAGEALGDVLVPVLVDP